MLTLSFSYRTFLLLRARHAYFVKPKPALFRIEAAPETRRQLEQLGMFPKAHEGEFYVLYDEMSRERLARGLEKVLDWQLSFWLYSAEPSFVNITQIPTNTVGKIFYFANQEKRNTLSQAESSSEADLFEVVSGHYIYTNASKQRQSLVLQNVGGQQIAEALLEPGHSHTFTLHGEAPGRFQILESTKTVAAFVLVPEALFPRPLGLIRLSWQGKALEQLKSKLQQEESDFAPIQFEIPFLARATYWKYFIVPKYENGFQDVRIDTGKTEVRFTGPTLTHLPNGRAAYLFEADQTLPLQQISDFDFQLIRHKDSKGKPIHRVIQRLPLARPEAIHPASREASSKIYSEIYVYL
ncbi:MAG: hypothetical protein HC913_16315 [Microscillaceae bacterium]|nr:hypothetical protein [Microscillaceae bacterium]